jgi:hypothetical protein
MLKYKIIGLALALVLIAGLVAVASNATGAFFSDTKDGVATGSAGMVKVGTSDLNLNFNNLMPGVPQTVTVDFQNIGSGHQDIWLVFPDRDALHGINDLGTYGAVKVTSTGGASFYSQNLNDRPNNGTTPLPRAIKLAADVPDGWAGTMYFTFQYASKLGDPSSSHGALTGGGVWNPYPLKELTYYTPTPGIALGSKNGLPFQIVGTEVGVEPGQLGTDAGF